MRPGQRSPGKVTLIRRAKAAMLASMRPGQRSPGKGRQVLKEQCITITCFNEAGAKKPRKGFCSALARARNTSLQ